MEIAVYVVDQAALGEAAMKAAALLGPAAVIDAVLAQAGRWGKLKIANADFTAVFMLIDVACETGEFLAELALVGSPYFVLAGVPGAWRFGYLGSELVEHIQPILNIKEEQVTAALATMSESANELYFTVRQCLDEAFVRGNAVAIVYLDE